MNSEIVSVLLPAIPLAIVAFNFRYTSLAGLMRNLSHEIDKTRDDSVKYDVLRRELNILTTRILLVKFALFFAAVSFCLCLLSLGTVLLTLPAYGHICLIAAVSGLCFSCIAFCAETILSTKALNLHLSSTLGHE